MTVVADSRKRITLQPAKPGDRFELQVAADGKVILTPLATDKKRGRVRLVKKNGYTVAVGTRAITQQEVRKFLDDFP